MFIFSYTAAVLAIVCISIAAVIFFERGRDLLARTLSYASISIGLWVGSNAAADVAQTPDTLIFWSGIALISAAFWISFYLCFVYVFVHGKRPGILSYLLYFVPTAVFTAGAFSKYSVVETFFPVTSPTQIIPGILYDWIQYFLFGGLLYGSIMLTLYYLKKADAERRLQILYIEAGFIAVFVGCAIFTVLLPLAGELRFFTVGPQFSIFFIAFSSYAIFKHRLLDIKVVIQKSVVYSLLFLIVAGFYLSVLYSSLLFQDTLSGPSFLLASILTAFAGIFGIPPIKAFFERATDRYFHRDRYVWSEAMDELSRLLNEKVDLDDLLPAIDKSLRGILRTKYAKVIALEAPKPQAADPAAHDDSDSQARRIEAKIPGELKTILFRCENYEGQLNALTDPDLLASSEIIIPSILQDRLVAVIGIGPKLSSEPYFEDDIALMKSFSFQAAVALEKARLYHEVKDYSTSLEGRVKQSAEAIRDLRRERTDLLHEISHELQEPIATIKARLEVVKEKCGDLPTVSSLEQAVERIEDFLQELSRNADAFMEGPGDTLAEYSDPVPTLPLAPPARQKVRKIASRKPNGSSGKPSQGRKPKPGR